MNMLAFSKASYLTIRERLGMENPDLDEETLADTVEGLTDLHDIVAAIVRSAITDEALAEGLKARIAEMQARLGRFEDRASKRRQIARDVMVETEIKKVTAPDLSISLRSSTPTLVVHDEESIPDSYWVIPEPRLNRQSLVSDLKSGAKIAGATLSDPRLVLTVRAK
ncbi:siphovirus Gp157 family protein [Pseudorhodoplanes sinuspersici]|uniref:Uncharacterized protein n=1 Tax=Pseudorhodoplanes sinuspersici TaxID=1235591 RepID=A0A1W6ZYC9_9HYPH|nr:siphovirus Gp157 family protein [Pseudorhodoplanes sinuspersici]ARQ02344.1 hypothetical protein CAK95_26990 [Pseudorhodoplanes sinuspersici]RKE74171.1 viral Gp157 protein [Pseudorhodoplanes sinuspersici]